MNFEARASQGQTESREWSRDNIDGKKICFKCGMKGQCTKTPLVDTKARWMERGQSQVKGVTDLELCS